MYIHAFVTGPWQANCYLLAAENPSTHPVPALIIDPGVFAKDEVDAWCQTHNLVPEAIVCTHGHLDHLADAARIANERGIPMYLHPDDYFMATEPARGLGLGSEALIRQILGTTTLPAANDLRELSDGGTLTHAGLTLEAIHAPGHSPGCVVLRTSDETGQVVFSGDVIFAGSIGRVDLPGGSSTVMVNTLRRLVNEIDDEAVLLPGHGPGSTMADERTTNPYIQEALT